MRYFKNRGFFRKFIIYIKRKPINPLKKNYLIQFNKKNKKLNVIILGSFYFYYIYT